MLWAKGLPLDEMIHRFTVGDDPVVDLEIYQADLLGSAAHAWGLWRAGFLGEPDVRALISDLSKFRKVQIHISTDQEDVHTVIEGMLGERGKRIHLARSRNDQVTCAVRLTLRERLVDVVEAVEAFRMSLSGWAEQFGETPMPGYTHGRRAMPSQLGLWAQAFEAALAEEVEALIAVDRRLDACPLGSGAGYGVPIAYPRQAVAERLGFSKAQEPVTDVQNSRGRHERAVAVGLAGLALVLDKFCADLWLFTTEEFGFLRLPDAFTTGSSIMPQKRNPDVIELMRGRAREVIGVADELTRLSLGLPSGYHRDFQLLKSPVLRALDMTALLFQIAGRCMQEIKPQAERIEEALSPELYATEVAYRRVQEGAAFRDAYREVAEAIASGRFEKAETTGNTEFRPFQPDPVSSQWASRRRSEMEATQARVFGDL